MRKVLFFHFFISHHSSTPFNFKKKTAPAGSRARLPWCEQMWSSFHSQPMMSRKEAAARWREVSASVSMWRPERDTLGQNWGQDLRHEQGRTEDLNNEGKLQQCKPPISAFLLLLPLYASVNILSCKSFIVKPLSLIAEFLVEWTFENASI